MTIRDKLTKHTYQLYVGEHKTLFTLDTYSKHITDKMLEEDIDMLLAQGYCKAYEVKQLRKEWVR